MKKLELVWTSFRQSFMIRPALMIMLFITVAVTTATVSMPARDLTSEIENALYASHFSWDINNTFLDTQGEVFSKSGIEKYGDELSTLDKDLLSNNGEISINVRTGSVLMYRPTDNTSLTEDSIVELSFLVRGALFTNKQIENGAQVMAVSKTTMQNNNLSLGDKIILCGSAFEIVGTHTDIEDSTVYIPYTAKLADYRYQSTTDIQYDNDGNIIDELSFTSGDIAVDFMAQRFTKSDIHILNGLGMQVKYHFDSYGIAVCTGEIVGVLLAGLIVIIAIVYNLNKRLSRKYSIYKTVGVSPLMLMLAMSIEAIVITLLGIGLGCLLEFCFYNIFEVDYGAVQHMEWLHAILTIGVTLVAIMIFMVVNILKVLHANSVDSKLMR